MELKQFNSFKELTSTAAEGTGTELERGQLICEILNTSYQNEIWIGLILDFLNDNDEDKNYIEYYLEPQGSYGTRKYTYRFISTNEDMPCSITDDDIKVLKRLNAQPKFILYDHEEKPNKDVFAYLEYERKLIDVIQAVGMTDEVKNYLCEYCFNRLKQENTKQSKKEQNDLGLTKIKKQ